MELNMELSQHGLEHLGACEAFRALPYPDGTVWPSGHPRWATGYGHTIDEGHEGEWQVPLSRNAATELLYRDLEPRVAALNALIHVPVTQHQFDALVSLEFNIGVEALATSLLLRCLNAGDYAGAAEQFGRWVKWRPKPGGPLETSAGLVLRRQLDRELFETPDEETIEALLARAQALQFDLSSLVDLTPHHHADDEV